MSLNEKQQSRLDLFNAAYGPQMCSIALTTEQALNLVLTGKVEIQVGEAGTVVVTLLPLVAKI